MRAKQRKTKSFDKLLEEITTGFQPDERETSILFDHKLKIVHIETSHPATARHCVEIFKNIKESKIDTEGPTLRIETPEKFCVLPQNIIKPIHRKKRV